MGGNFRAFFPTASDKSDWKIVDDEDEAEDPASRFSEFISFFIFHCRMSKKEVLRETYYFLKCLRQDAQKFINADKSSLFTLYRIAQHGDNEKSNAYLDSLKIKTEETSLEVADPTQLGIAKINPADR